MVTQGAKPTCTMTAAAAAARRAFAFIPSHCLSSRGPAERVLLLGYRCVQILGIRRVGSNMSELCQTDPVLANLVVACPIAHNGTIGPRPGQPLSGDRHAGRTPIV